MIPEAIRNFGLSQRESPQSESVSLEDQNRCCPRRGQMFQVGVSSPRKGANIPYFTSVKMQCFLSYGNSKAFFCFFSLKAQAQIMNYLSWNSGSICICWPFDLNKLLDLPPLPPAPCPPPPAVVCFFICKMGTRTRTGLPHRVVRRTKGSRSSISGIQVRRQCLGM